VFPRRRRRAVENVYADHWKQSRWNATNVRIHRCTERRNITSGTLREKHTGRRGLRPDPVIVPVAFNGETGPASDNEFGGVTFVGIGATEFSFTYPVFPFVTATVSAERARCPKADRVNYTPFSE